MTNARRRLQSVSAAFVASALLWLGACGGDGASGPPIAAAVAVSPPSASLSMYTTMQLSAVVKDSHGNALSGRSLTWASSDRNIAGVSNFGVVAGISTGTVTITATTVEGIAGSATLVITPDPVSAVDITSAGTTVDATFFVQLTATPKDSAGHPVPGRQITWVTNDDRIATVSGTGLVRGVAPGSVSISAIVGRAVGATTILVVPQHVGQVIVFPTPATVAVAEQTQLSTQAKDMRGNFLDGRKPSAWSSSNPSVATVDSNGVVTGVSVGSTNITAVIDSTPGSTPIVVSSNVVQSVSAAPGTVGLTISGQMQMSATSRNEVGITIHGHVAQWTSSNPAVATVNGSGLVTGVSLGAATITANIDGKLGSATINVGALPSLVSVVVGASHSCGLDASGLAYCWGSNDYGQIGDGTTSQRVLPTAVLGGKTFASLTTFGDHTCGMTPAQAAYCWGRNESGELGDGTMTSRSTPVAVSGGITFASIDAGTAHTCGVTADKIAYCWGSNQHGELGDGTTTNRATPVSVVKSILYFNYSQFIAVSARGAHTCAKAEHVIGSSTQIAHASYCWGDNSGGALGDGTVTERDTPAVAAGNLLLIEISPGVNHTCGRSVTNQVACWGRGSSGELGVGVLTTALAPVFPTPATGYVSISSGDAFSCAVTTGAKGYCWGDNSNGQLGDGSTIARSTPGAVAGALQFPNISAGPHHVCAVNTGGGAYCWGRNDRGQLGDGTTTNRSVPTQVRGQ